MVMTKKLAVKDAQERAEIAMIAGKLGQPFDDQDRLGVLNGALAGAVIHAEKCLSWIWRQWLLAAPQLEIRKTVDVCVERGLECRRQARFYDHLPQHDLLLLHCAILGASEGHLRQVVAAVGDSSGGFGKPPRDDGELYAAAWSGALKYWILGDDQRAHQEADLIWRARRDLLFAGPKPLAMAWLNRDWKKFRQQQEKDFEKLWSRARKDAWTIVSESDTELVVRTDGIPIGQMWCWGHCGMALLARHQGANIATDPFWFPAHALA